MPLSLSAIFRLSVVLKIVAVLIILLSIVPIMQQGAFDNEFIRISIILSSAIWTYFSSEHWLIRWSVSTHA